MKCAYLCFVVFSTSLFAGCISNQKSFVDVHDGELQVNGERYDYIGTNFWYGAILGSQGVGGDRKRLISELDFMKSVGINNLRILVGADGVDGVASKVEPALQLSPGKYNDAIFDGLDFLLAEMAKRDMYAVLFLNNSWEWSGGYSSYLKWTGHGEVPMPRVEGWNAFQQYVSQYAKSEESHILFKKHVKNVINRINRYTGVAYKNDHAIMAWQIGNEPRAFGEENKEAFAQWIADIAKTIKLLDSNHLLSIGSEGMIGCEGDMELWRKLHADSNIDYTTIHIWPNNWSWIDKEDMRGTLESAKQRTVEYITIHSQVANKLRKPLIIEEFGMPRDGFSFDEKATTEIRDSYYKLIFRLLEENVENKGIFQGCNFWAWGGFAKPTHTFWVCGDEYVGDPAQEEQGLNSVFVTDTTIDLVKKYNNIIRK